ncbi:MAG: Gp37 family protein, partial [Alistipes sp.]|nr:Gp37 family protein [Alistipes sp.]
PHQTQKPQIFVLVNGGEFDEREETTTIAQLETIQCELFFRAKNRRGKTGIFATYETVKKRLLGHRIKGSKTPIYFKSFGYVSGSHNCWQYALTFSFAAYSVQAVQPEDTPAIRQITHEIKQV